MSSSWWHGVALFPLVAVTTLLSDFGSRTFIPVSSSGGDPNVVAGIASLVLVVVWFWGGIVVALVVFVCLLADIRALGDDEHWSPSIAWKISSLAHLGAAVFSPLLLASIPLLTCCLYRRGDRLRRR
jgi:hypothetical protein